VTPPGGDGAGAGYSKAAKRRDSLRAMLQAQAGVTMHPRWGGP
jgi:hypothetical protein